MARKSDREIREEQAALERRLGVGGGEYARLHTARGDKWYIVAGSFHFPERRPDVPGLALGPIYERVSASNASFAAIAAERKIRKAGALEYDALLGIPLVPGVVWVTESVAEEIFRREP